LGGSVSPVKILSSGLLGALTAWISVSAALTRSYSNSRFSSISKGSGFGSGGWQRAGQGDSGFASETVDCRVVLWEPQLLEKLSSVSG